MIERVVGYVDVDELVCGRLAQHSKLYCDFEAE